MGHAATATDVSVGFAFVWMPYFSKVSLTTSVSLPGVLCQSSLSGRGTVYVYTIASLSLLADSAEHRVDAALDTGEMGYHACTKG